MINRKSTRFPRCRKFIHSFLILFTFLTLSYWFLRPIGVSFFIFLRLVLFFFQLLLGADLTWSIGDVGGVTDATSLLFMALPDDGDLNLDLTLAPPMVDDQAAPPVGEEPQQGPVVADLFPEVEELKAIINGLTSEEVQQVVGPYSDPIDRYMGHIFPDQAADILNRFPEDSFSAEQRRALDARAMAHFNSLRERIALLKSLDPRGRTLPKFERAIYDLCGIANST